jgi:nitrogen regulatory protein PII
MKAIDAVVPPTNLKELQSLLGKINFVRRFISNVTKGVAFLSTVEDQEGSEVCMG